MGMPPAKKAAEPKPVWMERLLSPEGANDRERREFYTYTVHELAALRGRLDALSERVTSTHGSKQVSSARLEEEIHEIAMDTDARCSGLERDVEDLRALVNMFMEMAHRFEVQVQRAEELYEYTGMERFAELTRQMERIDREHAALGANLLRQNQRLSSLLHTEQTRNEKLTEAVTAYGGKMGLIRLGEIEEELEPFIQSIAREAVAESPEPPSPDEDGDEEGLDQMSPIMTDMDYSMAIPSMADMLRDMIPEPRMDIPEPRGQAAAGHPVSIDDLLDDIL